MMSKFTKQLFGLSLVSFGGQLCRGKTSKIIARLSKINSGIKSLAPFADAFIANNVILLMPLVAQVLCARSDSKVASTIICADAIYMVAVFSLAQWSSEYLRQNGSMKKESRFVRKPHIDHFGLCGRANHISIIIEKPAALIQKMSIYFINNGFHCGILSKQTLVGQEGAA